MRSRSWPPLAGLLVAGLAAVVQADSRLVPEERMAAVVEVRDVRMTPDGTVTGVVVNKSDQTLRDVRLRVTYEFLWDRERSPGADSPGRLEEETVPGPIRPGRSVAFTHEPLRPLPPRSDGRFEPHVEVADLVLLEEPERTSAPLP